MTRQTRTPFFAVRSLALAAAAVLLSACAAQVRVAPAVYVPPVAVVQVRLAPPPLPVYVQPPCPVAGWIWTPGYWAWAPAGYFWVPGTWVAPPRIGVLWTPGYWGFAGGVYVWHAGYWGPHVGFYGGVHYGFGYEGVGYVGGRWVGNVFAYNRSVTRVNVTIVHNTYNETVVNNIHVTRVSYNGGAGGVMAVPTARERLAERERHFQPTTMQRRQVQQARSNPRLLAQANHGHPPIAATPRPGAFHARGTVRARGAEHQHAAARFGNNGRRPQDFRARPAGRRPAPKYHGPRGQRPNAKRQRRKERQGG
jgi:hypothetical protein